VFLVLGSILAAVAAIQLIVPELLSGLAFTTYGRIAPSARILLADGWLTIGLLGMSYHALSRITGAGVRRGPLAIASLILIGAGTAAGVVGVLIGYQSGLTGQEAPVWARLISLAGYLLGAISLVGTARQNRDRLGAAGWYLTAAPIWLTLSAVVAVVPTPDGVAGSIQIAFANAGFTGLFFVTAAVGLLYFVFTSIANADPTEPRPLAALGFWSLTLVWANLAAVSLIFSPAPDWYETLAVAFAIGSLIPLLTIAADIGLMMRGLVASITDRASLRYGVVASVALAAATIVNLSLAWRASSGVVQFSTWVNGVELLVVLGGGSFAVFATFSVIRGGRSGGSSAHLITSVLGLLLTTVGYLVGAVVVGFSWVAGPASQQFANAGDAWRITTDASVTYLWLAALGLLLFAGGQVIFVTTMGRTNEEGLAAPPGPLAYDLEFEGTPPYATWRRLMWGVAAVWVFAATMTWIIPVVDDTDREATLLADTSRTYAAGSQEAIGRQLYISEGCAECHTQQVRPLGTDVGLGPVSVAGDYANEHPALLGAYRFGPDLMHYASTTEFFDKVIVQAYLGEPRTIVPWSTKPSYSYLSSNDLSALVSYIETLE
jgi:cytochrome c oxidase cbb3-type subunit 1